MKANVVTKTRARKSVTNSLSRSYRYFENMAIWTLIEDLGWGYDESKARSDLRIHRFDILVTRTIRTLMTCETNPEAMQVMKEIIFKDGFANPNTKEGYTSNYLKMLAFAHLYAVREIAGYGTDKQDLFTTKMHEKRAREADVFDIRNELEMAAEGHVNGYGYKLVDVPKKFFNDLERFLFRIPKILDPLAENAISVIGD